MLPEPLALDSDCLIYLTETNGSAWELFLTAEGVGTGHAIHASVVAVAEVLVGLYREYPAGGAQGARHASSLFQA
jgi:hypothetical protein